MQITFRIPDWWPLAWRSTCRVLERENYSLRDALRENNAELRKYRMLVGGLRDGNSAITAAVEKIVSR